MMDLFTNPDAEKQFLQIFKTLLEEFETRNVFVKLPNSWEMHDDKRTGFIGPPDRLVRQYYSDQDCVSLHAMIDSVEVLCLKFALKSAHV